MLSALSPHLVGCLPGGAWTQAFTPHRRKHQALNYPNRGSRITCGHTPDRLAPIKWAEPGAVSNHLHKFSSLRPWVRMCLHARTCGWAATELQIPLTVQCAQGWRCLWSWWVNSCRNGYSHRGRVPKLLQCSCDPRPVTQRYVCSYWHRWTVPMLFQQAYTLSFFLFCFWWELSVPFLGFFFSSFFLISNIPTTLLLQTLISVISSFTLLSLESTLNVTGGLYLHLVSVQYTPFHKGLYNKSIWRPFSISLEGLQVCI